MSGERLPRTSIVIPCFNAADHIADTLSSVVAQSYPNLEVIVVDDHSTDGSVQTIEQEFPSVRLLRSTSHGASAARNLGSELSTGAYLQYLDADDLLAPGKLDTQVRALEESGADVAYGDWQRLEQRRGQPEKGDIVSPILTDPEIDLFTDVWSPPAAYLFRRSVVERVGGWREELPVIQDARFVLDCALQGGTFVRCDGVMALYRVHTTGSLSTRDPQAFVRDCLHNALQIESWWRGHGGLDRRRTDALVQTYGYVTRASFETDRETFDAAYSALRALRPRYRPASPATLRLAATVLGYPRAERVALWYRRAKSLAHRHTPTSAP
jgi:glycosyltransferase involved in cell wall biosynthesis